MNKTDGLSEVFVVGVLVLMKRIIMASQEGLFNYLSSLHKTNK